MTNAALSDPGRVATPAPPPRRHRAVRDLVVDVRRARTIRGGGRLAPGSQHWSARNTLAMLHDPLPMLLQHYERYGPVFTIRTLHDPVVWGIGPAVNQQVLLTEPDAFCLRESQYTDLAPLFGDGMLLTDGAYPKEIRRVVLPAFSAERITAAADITIAEVASAAERLLPGTRVDMTEWIRETVLGASVRVIFGLGSDPERDRRLHHDFEETVALWGHLLFAKVMQFARWPGSPYDRATRARAQLDEFIYGEIQARRSRGDSGDGILGLLLAATDGNGEPLRPRVIRDQVMTLLFGAHDTSTGAMSFMLYELGRNVGARRAVEDELDTHIGPDGPEAGHLDGATLPVLERTISETLRRYPTAWAGPRRTVRGVDVAGVHVPAHTTFFYSSWVTHHLPELYPDALSFDPDRFLPENRSSRPKGAYIPFGGGSRICVGMRFAQTMLRAMAAVLLTSRRFEPDPASPVAVAIQPTLRPRHGLPCRIYARGEE